MSGYGQRMYVDGFGLWYDSPAEDAEPVATTTALGVFAVTPYGQAKGWTTSPDRKILLSPEGDPMSVKEKIKCPYCGALFGRRQTQRHLIREHDYDGHLCPGSGQHPRSEADRRFLWKDDLDFARRKQREAEAEVKRLTEGQAAMTAAWERTSDALRHWETKCHEADAEVARLTVANELLAVQQNALRAARHTAGEYPWHCAVCQTVHAMFRGEKR